ncbi:MAG: acyltransferase family protein [Solobacterium sp.]|nr:acyltransferase family protein [Solobacterium sp.]
MKELLGCVQWRYFFFFLFGTLARKYFDKFKTVLNSSLFMALTIVAFFAMVLFNDTIDLMFVHWIYISFVLYGLLGVILIFAFFYKNENSFKKEKQIGRILQYVGRRTLDIYLLHFFFLPRHLDFLGSIFLRYNNPVVEFFVSLLLAIMVIGICLVISNVIRLSPMLGKILFGVNTKTEEFLKR